MPKDYQLTKNNEYWLPKATYSFVLQLVRYCESTEAGRLYDDLLDLSAINFEDSKRHGRRGYSNPTENRGIKRAEIGTLMTTVKLSWGIVPEEYREGIRNNILFARSGFRGDYAHRNTYGYWKKRFLWKIAENLNLIEN
ncbi:MAG: hypothetical protein FWG69_06340 [Oscillospiraceae bacterium]|nr:hypothetical protein [Oscillospiraceae bacterium]